MTYDNEKKLKKVLTFSVKCAIIFPVSERNTMTETYGANYAGFIRRTLKVTKHPFIPRKKSEEKDGKGLDFVPKVCYNFTSE